MILSFCHEEVIQHLFFTIVLCDIYGPFSSCTYVWSWRLVKWSGKTIKITSITWGSSDMLVYMVAHEWYYFLEEKEYSPLQVIYAISHRLHSWAILQQPEFWDTVATALRQLEQVAEGYHYPGILAAIYYYDWMSLEHAQNTFKLNVCVYHLGRGCEVVSRPCINSMYWS